MQRRCDRNRNRSKRRAIYCPVHGCDMNSMSQKYGLFAERAGQLQQRGMRRKQALMLVAAKTAVAIEGEWLEAFWCDNCQETKWYHVCKHQSVYELSLAPAELWQQATGVINPHRNPSVGEFTFRQSHVIGGNSIKDFWVIN
ncbi:hypothetical protein [Trichormus sp. NMC-1]|uniref:hypothetical protein n=1 Tax=Trichormus sp. NMC-1 TaxID=1853259 RepID=UPI0008DBF8FF|nr:hypothetical protein [Trichormus sp. NMC-1]